MTVVSLEQKRAALRQQRKDALGSPGSSDPKALAELDDILRPIIEDLLDEQLSQRLANPVPQLASPEPSKVVPIGRAKSVKKTPGPAD